MEIFFAKLLRSGAAQSAEYNGVKALLMSADHYLFNAKFANCTSHLFANLVLLFWKFWIQLLLDPAFIFVLISLWGNPFKVCFPNFLLQLSKLKFSPRVSQLGAQNLWIVEAKNFARVTFCFDKVTSSDRCAPHLLLLGITLVRGGLGNCLFFFEHCTQSSRSGQSSLLSNQSKTQGSWFLMMMGMVMTLKLTILYRPMSGKVSSGGHCVLHYCRPVLHWSFPGQ